MAPAQLSVVLGIQAPWRGGNLGRLGLGLLGQAAGHVLGRPGLVLVPANLQAVGPPPAAIETGRQPLRGSGNKPCPLAQARSPGRAGRSLYPGVRSSSESQEAKEAGVPELLMERPLGPGPAVGPGFRAGTRSSILLLLGLAGPTQPQSLQLRGAGTCLRPWLCRCVQSPLGSKWGAGQCPRFPPGCCALASELGFLVSSPSPQRAVRAAEVSACAPQPIPALSPPAQAWYPDSSSPMGSSAMPGGCISSEHLPLGSLSGSNGGPRVDPWERAGPWNTLRRKDAASSHS